MEIRRRKVAIMDYQMQTRIGCNTARQRLEIWVHWIDLIIP